MIEGVHHIDFVVRDLDAAAARFARILGREAGEREILEDRGIELVRFEVGGIWLILVRPTRQDSPVQAYLDEHGEGFFHIAFEVADVADEGARLRAEGVPGISREPRRGVEGWKLLDIPRDELFPIYSQLVEENDP